MIKIAIIGCGQRSFGLYNAFTFRKRAQVVAICDIYRDKAETLVGLIVEKGGEAPAIYESYKDLFEKETLDAVVIATSWKEHIDICLYAMKRGIPVGCEVAGAYTEEQLWRLIDCYEDTKTPIMMLENCCFGRMELLALNMKRLGLLGEIVHCECGYRHDLREEISNGRKIRHYRLDQYIHRNADNYPTHGIGPVAKLLDINAGNKFLTISSTASKAVGLKDYIQRKFADNEELTGAKFNQGDVITSVIRCENGETITMNLDTTLPRYYSRGFYVQGTRGMLEENNQSVFLDDMYKEEVHYKWNQHYKNVGEYYEKYDHELWKGYTPEKFDTHGGMDSLMAASFIDALVNNKPMPIDVYDMATWMIITALSERSIALGGLPVAFPDFTRGAYITGKNNFLK